MSSSNLGKVFGFMPKTSFLFMIFGLVLMILGGLLVAKNKQIAFLFVHEHTWGFFTSVARQNVAFIGLVTFIVGFALFGLFLLFS